MNKDSKIYVAGHRGLVGSALVNNLKEKGIGFDIYVFLLMTKVIRLQKDKYFCFTSRNDKAKYCQ